MTKENTDYLFEKYPLLFPKESRSNVMDSLMAFGFECGDGWFNLLNATCASIQDLIDTQREEQPIEQVEIIQVKQKWGSLRINTISHPDFIDDIIEVAETLSYHTCETCGDTKNVTMLSQGWIEPICQNCLNKRLENASISTTHT
jgi:hypothetical protein